MVTHLRGMKSAGYDPTKTCHKGWIRVIPEQSIAHIGFMSYKESDHMTLQVLCALADSYIRCKQQESKGKDVIPSIGNPIRQ